MTANTTHPYSFAKKEHLCGDIRLQKLFTEGKAFIVYPYRIVYSIAATTDPSTVSVVISVPKKRFKRAVKRNRLKRLTREAYRLQKAILIDALELRESQMHVSFAYVSNDMLEFDYISRKMKQALERLIGELPAVPTDCVAGSSAD